MAWSSSGSEDGPERHVSGGSTFAAGESGSGVLPSRPRAASIIYTYLEVDVRSSSLAEIRREAFEGHVHQEVPALRHLRGIHHGQLSFVRPEAAVPGEEIPHPLEALVSQGLGSGSEHACTRKLVRQLEKEAEGLSLSSLKRQAHELVQVGMSVSPQDDRESPSNSRVPVRKAQAFGQRHLERRDSSKLYLGNQEGSAIVGEGGAQSTFTLVRLPRHLKASWWSF
jgi:hypothetical protein